jgi:phosphate-selective porin
MTAGTARGQTAPTTVDASGVGVTFESGPNSLTISSRVQVRWTLDDREASDTDTVGSGVGLDDGALGEFDVARLRLELSGGAYRPWLRYSFQLELGRSDGASDSKIKDAYIEIRPVGRSYSLQIGQTKAPFSLQQLTSSGRQQFVDRALTDDKFAPGRDMGVLASGTVLSEKLGWDAGIFNGSGEAQPQNNGAHLYVGRIFYDPLGPHTLSEGSSESSGSRTLHFGVGGRTGKAIHGMTTEGVVQDVDDQTAVNGEFGFTEARFSASAEYFWMRDEQQNPIAGPDIDSRGYYVQGGVMAVPQRLELGVRYAAIDGDTDIDDSDVREIRGVASYYWRGHNLKLQADAGQVRYGPAFNLMSERARQGLPETGTRLVAGTSLADVQLRIQMQLTF